MQQKRKHMQKVVFSPKDRYYGIFIVNFVTDLFSFSQTQGQEDFVVVVFLLVWKQQQE